MSSLSETAPAMPHVDARAPSSPEEAPTASAARARLLDRRYVVAALMLVMVLASMEQTVISTAMPTIIGELHGLEHYSWVASIYLLACTVSMPLYGRLADVLGRKRVVVVAILIFCVASTLAASARSMPQLVVYRGLQGLGAGGIMPVVLTILADLFTLEERARIQGLFSAVWGTSSLAGPALGAVLVNTLGWRSVFFVNLPFGLLGLGVLLVKYRERDEPHTTDLDLPGIAGLAVGCGALLTLVSRLGPGGWSHGVAATLLVVTVTSLALVWVHERRTANPVLPPALFLSRIIGPSVVGSLLLGAAFLSLDTYVPLYVQGGRGGGATAAASVVTPVMLTWASSGVLTAPLLVRWGFRKVAIVGSLLMTAGFGGLLACALLSAPQWVITLVLAVTGLGLGPASMSFLLSGQGAVPWQQRGMVTGTIQFARTIGGAVGVGVLGAVFNALSADAFRSLRGAGMSPAEMLEPRTYAALPAGVRLSLQQTISHGLLWVFAAMAASAVACVFVSLMMVDSKADHAIGKGDALEAWGG